MKRFRHLFVVLAFCVAAPAWAIEDVPIDAFFGRYQGSGIANSRDSLYFGITMRDLDVTIGETSDGFSVEWTTVLRQGGTPNNPEIRRRSSSISFRPTDSPRRFDAVERTDPYTETGLSWARLAGQTLTVNVLTINEGGKYNLQSYVRTLGGNGMELEFLRIKDGEPTRTVTGRLIRQD